MFTSTLTKNIISYNQIHVVILINIQRTETSLNLRSYDDIISHITILELIPYENNLMEVVYTNLKFCKKVQNKAIFELI
jgi:hypothetical protein